MNWFLVIFAILGLIMGIAPGFVADNVEICGDETRKLVEKHKAGCKIRIWLYIFGLVIYLSLALLFGRLFYDYDGQIKELKARIEVLEEPMPQTDTTTVDIQNI